MGKHTFALICTPIFGFFMLALGNGFLTTLVPLRLSAADYSVQTIGYVSAAYYAGLCAGALINERLLMRAGYIRAYACFCAIVAVSALIQGVSQDIYVWLGVRLLCGWATAGAFLVIESWLLSMGDAKTRGRILAFYMVAFYGAMTIGQLLIGPLNTPLESSDAQLPFIFAAMIAALSLVPITMIPRSAPLIEQQTPLPPWQLAKITPTGSGGALGAGIMMGAIYSVLPLYLDHLAGGAGSMVGIMMAVVVVGGMLLQYPIGLWSDRTDRQWVLIWLSAFLVGASALLPLLALNHWTLGVGLFVFGGAAFALYPVTISHAGDRAPAGAMVGMAQGMLFVNSLGSVLAGPLISPLMERIGDNGFFVGSGLVFLLLMLFFGWRRTHRSAPEPAAPFPSMPTTPHAATRWAGTDEYWSETQQAHDEREAHLEDAEREKAEDWAWEREQEMLKEGRTEEELRLARATNTESEGLSRHNADRRDSDR
ncbi:putative MFS-type transporter YcaD [Carnimonas sp. R-84981]|uniref:MFS transporter n=1 Tax=Carnimonas bestiolae TaxID=3402172 RepID=UPI003EDBE77A